MNFVFLAFFSLNLYGSQSKRIKSDDKLDCVPAFERLSPKHPDFLRTSVRDPSKRLLDKGYPVRLYDSLRASFVPWFTGQGNLANQPYIDILRRQHKILVTGMSGQEVYRGASRIAFNLASNYVVAPSVFRHEYAPGYGGFSFAFRTDLYLSRNQSPEYKSLVKRYKKNREKNAPPEPSGDSVDDMPLGSSAVELLELPRVGTKVITYNTIYENYVSHTYLKSKHVPAVLNAMIEIMNEVRELHRSPKAKEGYTTNRVLQLLTEYVYLGVHSHLFTGGNYSLVMGQVNYLLGLWNLRGISQSDLDYVALARPFDTFSARFIQDIVDVNPKDQRIKVPQLKKDQALPPTLNQTTVLVHIASIGDRPFWGSGHIGQYERANPLEGLLIPPPNLPKGNRLVYRATLAGLGETPWVPAGMFLGTRGQGVSIVRLAFRIEGPDSDKFDISYQTFGAQTHELSNQKNGKWSAPKNSSEAIRGFKISLTER